MSIEMPRKLYTTALSDPQANFLFSVAFFVTKTDRGTKISGAHNQVGYDMLMDDHSRTVIKASLPGIEQTIATSHFLGTKKSYVVRRDYSGDTTLSFYMRSESNENLFILKNIFREEKEFKDVYHYKEFANVFDRITITLYTKMFSKTDALTNFHLHNCIVTKVDMGDLDYEGESLLNYNVTVHYDDWTYDIVTETGL